MSIVDLRNILFVKKIGVASSKVAPDMRQNVSEMVLNVVAKSTRDATKCGFSAYAV